MRNRLYWITKSAGEREGSGLMKANAWHHRSDAVSSVVALIGVGKTFCDFRYHNIELIFYLSTSQLVFHSLILYYHEICFIP